MPRNGPLADFGAAWLGWDVVAGCETAQIHMPGLHDITMTPRKYGFHGTLKPPFRLKEGRTVEDLKVAAAEMAARLVAAHCDGLELSQIGRFLALTPYGDLGQLQRVAEACVRELDDFRAPARAAEIERRRAAGLSERQDALLARWGYPYVFEEFRFHLTLSGKLDEASNGDWFERVKSVLPELPVPFVVDQIALCGEREDGRFELIHRYTLTG